MPLPHLIQERDGVDGIRGAWSTVTGAACTVCHTRAVAPSMVALDHVRARVPLYTVSGAARLLEVPTSTFATWVNGYERSRPGRLPTVGTSMITRIAHGGREPSIPFIGLAEGMALAAFRRQRNVPLPEIRRGVAALEAGLKLEHGLASRHLYLIGPKLLYDYAETAGVVELMELVELHAGQTVFAPLVREYLEHVVYDDHGWASRIRLPGYEVADIWVEPYLSSGEPYFYSSGVPVRDIVSRSLAGDPLSLLAEDYDVPQEQIAEAVAKVQSRSAA